MPDIAEKFGELAAGEVFHQHLSSSYGVQFKRNHIGTLRFFGSLVVRASDFRPEGLGSIPDATKYPPSTRGVRAR
ncbi:hypothetical protein TNCV_1427321 [Trichonephila clavipes]|nr:hypothetical protein TNCV_1427321 [Trichonephila clavipes]